MEREHELKNLVRVATCDKHGEYEETGKEYKHPFEEGMMVVRWRGHCAECTKEAIHREDARKAAKARYELQERVRASGIPSRFRACRLDNYIAGNCGQQNALNVARGYVSDFDDVFDSGRNLLFTGMPGCGKTHLATAIGMALMEMRASVRYSTVGNMIRRFTDTWGRHDGESETRVMNDLVGADLLILDEAGVQSGSDVELRTIFNVIDGRYRERLPTLVVSNLSIKNLTACATEEAISSPSIGRAIAARRRCAMQPNDEVAGVLETLNWLEPVAANSPVLSGKHEQAMLVKAIGERMRQARELCNLSQSAAAKRLGYANPSKLSKVEAATDTNSVPLWLITAAARVYEVSVDFLFGITDDWETGTPRGTQPWLLDAWQKMRERDLRTLDRVHAEVVTVSTATADLVAAVNGVGEALSIYRARNEGFEDSPASSLLTHRLAKLEACARNAEAGLKRFHLGKFGEAA